MPGSDDPVGEVKAVGRLHYAAAIAADVTVLAGLLSDDLVYTHSNGLRQDNTSYLGQVGSGFYRDFTINHQPDQVWVAGDVAVVTGTQSSSRSTPGKEFQMTTVSMDVWCRRDGGWRLYAHQTSVIPARISSPGSAVEVDSE